MINLIKNIDKFQNQSLVPDNINFLKGGLEKYKEYAKVFNPVVENKYKIDINRIDALLASLSLTGQSSTQEILDNSKN